MKPKIFYVNKIEKNTGVKFPGTSLDQMKDLAIKDIEISQDDTIVIETATPETNKFIFQYEDVEVVRYGKCDHCYKQQPLVVHCRCREVQYCSNDCLKKDIRIHQYE